MDPLQHGLQLVHARRPQDQVGAEGDELPPVLHHGSGVRARVGKGVAHGFSRVMWGLRWEPGEGMGRRWKLEPETAVDFEMFDRPVREELVRILANRIAEHARDIGKQLDQ